MYYSLTHSFIHLFVRLFVHAYTDFYEKAFVYTNRYEPVYGNRKGQKCTYLCIVIMFLPANVFLSRDPQDLEFIAIKAHQKKTPL